MILPRNRMRAVAAAVPGEAAPKAGGCQPRAKHQHSRAALMQFGAALLVRLTRRCIRSSLRMRGAHFALGLFSCAARTRIQETGRFCRHRRRGSARSRGAGSTSGPHRSSGSGRRSSPPRGVLIGERFQLFRGQGDRGVLRPLPLVDVNRVQNGQQPRLAIRSG